MDATLLPAVITSTRGRVVEVALMNEKAAGKSTEQGELWVVHKETGRVLPHEKGLPVAKVLQKGHFYLVELAEAAGAEAATGQAAAGIPDVPGATIAGSTGTGASDADSRISGDDSALAFLEKLAHLIKERHRTMPEGSYTTHLFESGESKIRKKTGEEAVEVLLAESDEHLISESADLIYHLMVLLEARGLSLSDVAAKLQARHAPEG